MTINLVLPQLGSQGKGTKDYIISILSAEWALSAKEIKSRLSKEVNGSLTSQAVYKSLNDLENQNVLLKENGKYALNHDWADEIESFAREILKRKYKSLDFLGTKTIITNSLYETDMMLLEVITKIIGAPKEKPVLCLHWNHAWVPLFLNNEKYQHLKKVCDETELYNLTRGSTVVDKWCIGYFAKRGANEKMGVDVAQTIDLAIIDDHVIPVFYPIHIKKELDKCFSSVSNISELDTGELFEKVFMKPARITIHVIRDKHLAEQLRQETLEYFKEPQK